MAEEIHSFQKSCSKLVEIRRRNTFMAVKNKSWAESWDDEKGYRGAESLASEEK